MDSGGEKVRDDGANILVQMRVKASGGVCYLCGINLSIETRLYATLMNAPGPKRPHTALLCKLRDARLTSFVCIDA